MAVTDGTLQLQLKLMASKLDFKASSTPTLNIKHLPISFQKQAASNIETETSNIYFPIFDLT